MCAFPSRGANNEQNATDGDCFLALFKKKQSLTDCLHSGRSLWVLIAEGNVETPTFFLTDGRWRIYRISKRDLTACKIMKK